MEKKTLIADKVIGKNQETLDLIADLFSAITDSELTELQQQYLALKMLEILNSEISTCVSVINGYQTILEGSYNLQGTVAADNIKSRIKCVKKYLSEIKTLQQVFGNYFKKVLWNLNASEALSPLEYEDAIEHYINQRALTDLRNDRSSFSKKIRKVFRGFSGSVRGVQKYQI